MTLYTATAIGEKFDVHVSFETSDEATEEFVRTKVLPRLPLPVSGDINGFSQVVIHRTPTDWKPPLPLFFHSPDLKVWSPTVEPDGVGWVIVYGWSRAEFSDGKPLPAFTDEQRKMIREEFPSIRESLEPFGLL